MKSKENVLFLSGSEEKFKLINPFLNRYGIKVHFEQIKSGLDYDDIIHKRFWDVVLSDYEYWKVNGLNILRNSEDNEFETPYIIIGEDIEEHEILSLIDDGITDYVRIKDLNRLIIAIKRAIKCKNKYNNLKRHNFSKCLIDDEFQTLLKISNLLIYKLDLNSKFLEINKIFTESLGYGDIENLHKHNVYDLIHPNDAKIFSEAIENVLRGESVKNIRYRIKKKDGANVQLLSTISPIINDENQIIEILIVSKDLTNYTTTQQYINNRIHRQEIIAKFGLEAITEKNIEKLFRKATSLLAKILDVEYTKVLELLPGGKKLKLVAGVGWKKGLVGVSTVENNKNSQAGYTLLKTTPVIVENLNKESRFFAPKLLADHNVISGMSVIIPGPDAPFGILGVHTNKHQTFSKDDINFLQTIANILADVILRDSTEKELIESEEKYRMITEQSLLGTLIIVNNKIIFANKGISDILGFSIDVLRSWDLNSISDNIHPKDLQNYIKKINKILKKEVSSFQAEIQMRTNTRDYIYTRHYIKKIHFKGSPALHINIIDITKQKRNENLLESSLKEKEILLKEIHHRVKNNLQIISSLIVLQEQYIKDDHIINIFKDFQSRIKTMALIHQKLYDSENFSMIDLSKYIKDLIDNLQKVYSTINKQIKVDLNIEHIELNLDEAISCGLIINELVSNSLKYAFSKVETGRINISLKKTSEKNILLEVRDDGPGLPDGFDYKSSNTLGLKLVETITKQMKGNFSIKNKDGTNVLINWEI